MAHLRLTQTSGANLAFGRDKAALLTLTSPVFEILLACKLSPKVAISKRNHIEFFADGGWNLWRCSSMNMANVCI